MMLSEKAIAMLPRFRMEIMIPAESYQAWIKFWVDKERPNLSVPEVINQLLTHLDRFLCIDEIYESLDLGGCYSCETIYEGEVTEWWFNFGEDNPYQAVLSLSCVPKLWPTGKNREFG